MSLFKSDPPPGQERGGRKSKQKLAVTMTGDPFVIKKHMIDPYSKGNKIIA